jgi:hypothetical protein
MPALPRWSPRTATTAGPTSSCRALPKISAMGNSQKVTMELPRDVSGSYGMIAWPHQGWQNGSWRSDGGVGSVGGNEDGNLQAHRRRPIGASPAVACASSLSIAASRVVASSTSPAASGRRSFAIASWKSAVHCITFRCVSLRGNRWFNGNELLGLRFGQLFASLGRSERKHGSQSPGWQRRVECYVPRAMAPKTLRHKIFPRDIMRNVRGINRPNRGLNGHFPTCLEEG